MKRLFSRIGLVFASLGLFFVLSVAFAPAASAACPSGQVPLTSDSQGRVCCPKGSQGDATTCVVAKYVNPLIRLLAIVAGVAVVGGVIWGAIQYGSSAGDPQKVAKGKRTITQALVGLVAFLLLGSFIQFMTPLNVVKASGGSCQRQFLGLKTWYAYIPKDQINPSTCEVSQDLPLLPTKNSVGVVPAVALAIVDDLLIITAYIAVAFIVTGGIQYITSQGTPDITKRAQSTILNALIALAVALVARAVVIFLGKALTS